MAKSAAPKTTRILFRIGFNLFFFSSAEAQLWLDQNLVHHAEIFVQQDVTVKGESAGNGWVSKIHAHGHTGVSAFAGPVRNFNGVAQVLIGDRLPVYVQQHEVDLVDVKRVRFKSAVLNGPVFNGSNFGGDYRLLVRLENLLFLSGDGEIEMNWAIGAGELFGKIKRSGGSGSRVAEVREF